MADNKAVALATYPNDMEAQFITQILDDNDIPAYVKPLGAGYGALGVTQFIPHRVYVSANKLKEAQELLGIEQDDTPSSDNAGRDG